MSEGKTDYTHALKPYGITHMLKNESLLDEAIWIEPDGRFMVHPAKFVAAVKAATSREGRAVYIGSDKVQSGKALRVSCRVHSRARVAHRSSI